MSRLTVFLHGYTGHADSWDAVIARLPRGERAIAITLWGHDFDPNPTPTSFEKEVERVASIIRNETTDPVRICGYSLGGRIAIGLLATQPALIASALLIGAHPGLASPEERSARAASDEAWASLAEREGSKAFATAWSAQPLFKSQLDLHPEAFEKRLRHSGPAMAIAMRAFSLATMPNFWPALEHIEAPTRFVAGELDRRFTELGKRIVATMPHATLEIAPGCGHNVVLENPDAIAQSLRALD